MEENQVEQIASEEPPEKEEGAPCCRYKSPLLILIAVGAIIALAVIAYYFIIVREPSESVPSVTTKVSKNVGERAATSSEATLAATPEISTGKAKEELDAALEDIDDALSDLDDDLNAIEDAGKQSDEAPEL